MNPWEIEKAALEQDRDRYKLEAERLAAGWKLQADACIDALAQRDRYKRAYEESQEWLEKAETALMQASQFEQMNLGYWEMARRCPLLVEFLSKDNCDARARLAKARAAEILEGGA